MGARTVITPPEENGVDSDTSDVNLPLNSALEILAHHHRREILRLLISAPNNSITINDITNHLSDQEAKRTGEHPGRDQIEMTLYHVHLPKLIEVELVDYDARSQEVRYWPHERLEDILDYLEAEEPY